MGVAAGNSADVRADDAALRTCAVSRAELPKSDLIRFVAGPDGGMVPDLACRLPGRGVWVLCDRRTVAAAVRTKAFGRNLKREVTAAADLPETVGRLLLRRVLDALSLANKAGLVITGFAKIDSAIAAGTPSALIHGRDAAADGVEKLDRRFLAMCRDAGLPPVIVRELAIEQLSLALGRANVVHAALMMGGAAQQFLSAAERFRRYNTEGSDVK